MSNVITVLGRDFRMCLGHEGGIFTNGISALMKESPQILYGKLYGSSSKNLK
jgi:hypothetical protein